MKTLNGLVLIMALGLAACNSDSGSTPAAIGSASVATAPVQVVSQSNSIPSISPSVTPSATPSATPTFVQPTFAELTQSLQLNSEWITSLVADNAYNSTSQDGMAITISATGEIGNVLNASICGYFSNQDSQNQVSKNFQISTMNVDGASITYLSQAQNGALYTRAKGTITITGTATGTYNIGNGPTNFVPSDFNIYPGTYYYTYNMNNSIYSTTYIKVVSPNGIGASNNFYEINGGTLTLYSDSARQNQVYQLVNVL